MSDKEKVIDLLFEISEYFRDCRSNASFASKAENHFWELQNAASEAAVMLKEQPEIVRCKDCKHYKPYRGRVSGNLLHECEIFDLDIDEPDWFCANGERRCEND